MRGIWPLCICIRTFLVGVLGLFATSLGFEPTWAACMPVEGGACISAQPNLHGMRGGGGAGGALGTGLALGAVLLDLLSSNGGGTLSQCGKLTNATADLMDAGQYEKAIAFSRAALKTCPSYKALQKNFLDASRMLAAKHENWQQAVYFGRAELRLEPDNNRLRTIVSLTEKKLAESKLAKRKVAPKKVSRKTAGEEGSKASRAAKTVFRAVTGQTHKIHNRLNPSGPPGTYWDYQEKQWRPCTPFACPVGGGIRG